MEITTKRFSVKCHDAKGNPVSIGQFTTVWAAAEWADAMENHIRREAALASGMTTPLPHVCFIEQFEHIETMTRDRELEWHREALAQAQRRIAELEASK